MLGGHGLAAREQQVTRNADSSMRSIFPGSTYALAGATLRNECSKRRAVAVESRLSAVRSSVKFRLFVKVASAFSHPCRVDD